MEKNTKVIFYLSRRYEKNLIGVNLKELMFSSEMFKKKFFPKHTMCRVHFELNKNR
jgi:hypothetical protein